MPPVRSAHPDTPSRLPGADLPGDGDSFLPGSLGKTFIIKAAERYAESVRLSHIVRLIGRIAGAKNLANILARRNLDTTVFKNLSEEQSFRRS